MAGEVGAIIAPLAAQGLDAEPLRALAGLSLVDVTTPVLLAALGGSAKTEEGNRVRRARMDALVAAGLGLRPTTPEDALQASTSIVVLDMEAFATGESDDARWTAGLGELLEALRQAGCADVRELSLSGCGDNVTDAGLAHVGQLQALVHLNLCDCRSITDRGLAHVGRLQALTFLDLYRCVNITGDNITDAGLAHLGQLHALAHLNLGDCDSITDAGLAHLGQLRALVHLSLWGCCQITDAGLAHLAQLQALAHLNLAFCGNITDAGLAHLGPLRALEHLDLSNCDHINTIPAAVCWLPRLRRLRTHGMEQLQQPPYDTCAQGVEAMRSYPPYAEYYRQLVQTRVALLILAARPAGLPRFLPPHLVKRIALLA